MNLGIVRYRVVALSGPTRVDQKATNMIETHSLDEGVALLIYTLQPHLEARAEVTEGFQPGVLQLVFKFELFHNKELFWTGYSPVIMDKRVMKIKVAPTVLADLSGKRRSRDVEGAWRMKGSAGVIDLQEYRLLEPKKMIPFMKKLAFEKFADIRWRVVPQVHTKLNSKGQFSRGVVETGRTYSADEI